jgi:hypothetical protein
MPKSVPGTPAEGGPSLIQRAEELLLTLPGVIAARVIGGDAGTVNEVHLLTTLDVAPKQTVRNVESALIAQLGLKVDHRKISVATTVDHRKITGEALAGSIAGATAATEDAAAVAREESGERRRLYFEDVEVRRSRSRGVTCRVTLRKDEESFVGETEGPETARSRVELAAKAALLAIAEAEERVLVFEGAKIVDAFDRQFVFVVVAARLGRETIVLTGSCEIRDSAETAAALAVLDATNRWMGRLR